MKMLPQVLFWLGLISIPFAWLVWYFGSEIEIIRPVLARINDPALRAHIRRGELIAALGGAAVAWPLAVCVQQAAPLVGFLNAGSAARWARWAHLVKRMPPLVRECHRAP